MSLGAVKSTSKSMHPPTERISSARVCISSASACCPDARNSEVCPQEALDMHPYKGRCMHLQGSAARVPPRGATRVSIRGHYKSVQSTLLRARAAHTRGHRTCARKVAPRVPIRGRYALFPPCVLRSALPFYFILHVVLHIRTPRESYLSGSIKSLLGEEFRGDRKKK